MSADMPEDNLPDEKQTHDAVGPAASESEPAAVAVAETGKEDAPPKHWYIIHTYSGFEQKVADSLRFSPYSSCIFADSLPMSIASGAALCMR